MSQPSSQASTDHAGQQDALALTTFKSHLALGINPIWLLSPSLPPHPGYLHRVHPLRCPHGNCREQKTAGAGSEGCGHWGSRCPRLIPASLELTSEEPKWYRAGPARPPFSTPKWRGDGLQTPRKGNGTCGEAPKVTCLALGGVSAIPRSGPVFAPSRFFPGPSQWKARIGFRPPSLGYKYHPLHTPLSPPPNLASARALAQRQLSLPVRARGLWLERFRLASLGRTPFSPPLQDQKRGAESRGGTVGRRDAPTVGGKGDAEPSDLTPSHLLAPNTCLVSSKDPGVRERLGAEGSQAGSPSTAERTGRRTA